MEGRPDGSGARRGATDVPRDGHNAPGMDVPRIAWLLTVALCMLGAGILLLSGYQGYAAVSAAVGLSAAINLR